MSYRQVLWYLLGRGKPSRITEAPRKGEWVEATLSQTFKGWQSGISRLPMDSVYWAPSRDGFETIRNERGTQNSWLPYTTDRFDCEDFASAFRTYATRDYGVNTVGIVVDWSADPTHSYNIILLANDDVLLYEPQSDTTFSPDELPYDETHKMERAKIII